MTRTSVTSRSASVVAAIALLVSACGSDSNDVVSNEAAPTTSVGASETTADVESEEGTDDSPAAVEANGDVVDVVALDNSFRPETIEIVAGTAVGWENRGRNDHDVLPADETLAWGVDVDGFAPGDEYTLLFDTPGEFAYFCSIHGTKDVGMIGTVVVLPRTDDETVNWSSVAPTD